VLDIVEEISLCTFSFSIQIVFPVKYKKGVNMWMTADISKIVNKKKIRCARYCRGNLALYIFNIYKLLSI
jgi:hypothetical protein